MCAPEGQRLYFYRDIVGGGRIFGELSVDPASGGEADYGGGGGSVRRGGNHTALSGDLSGAADSVPGGQLYGREIQDPAESADEGQGV